MQVVLEPAAALPGLVPAAGTNSLVAAALGVPALAGMADTGVGTACEAESCNHRHMVGVGSMEGTEHHGSKAAAADAWDSPVLSCLMPELARRAVALACCHRPPAT